MRLSHRSIAISDRSSIGEARRAAVQAAQSLGFDEGRRSNIGIVATEAATNILCHARSGELLVCPFSEGATSWLDLFALDSGPGIAEVGRAMEDGFSTNGTAGQGLGAINRLSENFSVYSASEKGTACWARFVNGPAVAAMGAGVVNVPVHREILCGDGFLIVSGAARTLYMLVDGLGHGPGAAAAADEAVETLTRYSDQPLAEIMSRSHDALKKTRGAALSIAAVDHERRVLSYIGIGNVSAVITTGTALKALTAQNGTLGMAFPRTPQEYTYPVERNSLLLLFSDGLSTKSALSAYPGLQNRHPALIASVLFRDFSRKRDDATVLVAPVGKEVQ